MSPADRLSLVVLTALTCVFSLGLQADEPDWFRRDPAQAATAADLIVVAKIRAVSVLSGKTGQSLKRLPGYVDERYQGQRLRLGLEHAEVLWPVGGPVPEALTISWDGITTSFVTAQKNSTVILLLAKLPSGKAPLYTTPGYWPLVEAGELPAVQGAIAARSAAGR